VGARRLDPVGGRTEDLDGVGPQIRARTGRDLRSDELTGEAVAHEHDLAIGRSAYTPAPGGNGADLQLEDIGNVGGHHGM
jgi:hypothetical protein